MASGSDVKVTVTIEPEDARKLAEEVFELRERLKEAEDRAASWEALDAEANIGADEVSRQLRDLKAELADVRAQWQADVGSAIARAQTAEADARRWRAEAHRMMDLMMGEHMRSLKQSAAARKVARYTAQATASMDAMEEQVKDARAEAARLRAALDPRQLWEDLTNTEGNGAPIREWIVKYKDFKRMVAALRGPAQSEKGE